MHMILKPGQVSVVEAPTLPPEKPQNGLAGLKHWRHDILAGLLVSLISLPFSLGIAVASGGAPIAGLISAIIAGLLLPFLGGAFVTISGPAAGLAPVLLVAMATLGGGDLAVGYPLLLGVICMAGCVQIVLSFFKAARFSALFPSSVVEGMLCSIGLLIIGKQLPNFIGRPFEAHEFFEIVAELPSQLMLLNPQVFLIGAGSLALIFALAAAKAPWFKIVPPQVVAVAVATIAAWALALDPAYLIHIPDKPFEHGFALPNFGELWSNHALWFTVVTTVVTLTLIDGVESLATALAVDKIDPFRRKSNPNRILFAMGVSNICSSALGGLTIIPGGVKSKACIVGGGRTLWANFYNAVFLLVFLFLAKDVINLIPLSALAAVLIYTGYKLCELRIWRHVARIGREQLLVFGATVLATLLTDLLWGIAFGIFVKLLVNLWFSTVATRRSVAANGSIEKKALKPVASVARQFRSPVASRGRQGDAYHIQFEGPLVCFNNLQVNKELERIPADATEVYLDLTHVPLVDHTSCENLLDFVERCEDNGKKAVYRIVGLDRMERRSAFPSCMRLASRNGEDRDTGNGHESALAGNGNGSSASNGNGHGDVASNGNGYGHAASTAVACLEATAAPTLTQPTRRVTVAKQASKQAGTSAAAPLAVAPVQESQDQSILARMGLLPIEAKTRDVDGEICRLALLSTPEPEDPGRVLGRLGLLPGGGT